MEKKQTEKSQKEIDMRYNLARYLHLIFTNDSFKFKKEILLEELDLKRILLLWEILFETDTRDRELLQGRIYHYGSLLKDEDSFGRELFVCLVTLLDLL